MTWLSPLPTIMLRISARRALKSFTTSPMWASGVTISAIMIGSSSTGLAFEYASLKAICAATLKAMSLESTS